MDNYVFPEERIAMVGPTRLITEIKRGGGGHLSLVLSQFSVAPRAPGTAMRFMFGSALEASSEEACPPPSIARVPKSQKICNIYAGSGHFAQVQPKLLTKSQMV